MTPFPTAGLDVEVRQPDLPGFQMSQLWTFSCGARAHFDSFYKVFPSTQKCVWPMTMYDISEK